MSVNAETLNVILAARDREFARAMEANTRRIERFAKNAQKDLGSASSSFDQLANAAKAFASVAAVQQLATWVREAADRLGDLKDAASAIGITTDALQQLRYAAQLNGVDAATLQTALDKLTKNLGSAAMGGSAAKKSLDELGLSASALTSIPMQDALGIIADKLAGIENPAQRAALAADLFGKSGVGMVNVLAHGSKGLQEMADEAQRLGVVINQDIIQNAAEAGDKLDAMSMVISANLTQALVNLAPVLIQAAQGIAILSQAVKDFLASGGTGLVPPMSTEEVRAAADDYKALREEYDAVAQAKYMLKGIDAQYDQGITVDLRQEAAAIEALRVAEENLAKAKEGLAQKRQAEANLKGTVTAIVEENNALEEQIRLQAMSTEERIRSNAAKEKAAFIDKAMADASIIAGGIVSDETTAKILELADAHEQLYINAEMSKVAQKGSSAAMSESQKSSLAAKEALAAYKLQIEELGLTFDEFNDIARSIQSSMEDAFMGMVDGTMTAGDAFRGMAREIIAELYRVMVVQRMVGSFATATAGGSGILGMIGGAIGIKASASGNNLAAGQASVVGEHGRELFVPNTDGRVMTVANTKQIMGGGGGVTIQQSINVTTGVQQTVRAEIMQMLPKIADASKAAVLDARRRGGSFAATFG